MTPNTTLTVGHHKGQASYDRHYNQYPGATGYGVRNFGITTRNDDSTPVPVGSLTLA
jgi:hypothetical protein